MINKLDRPVVYAMGASFLLYLVLRAAWIPLTHDEAATCLNHVPRRVMDILTYSQDPVPNNHILNTIGIKLFAGLFGMNQFTARIPSLLGGLMYIFAVSMLSFRLTRSIWLRWVTVVLFFTNPFVDEFFALARGYGFAVGFMMLAIWLAEEYMDKHDRRYLKWSLWASGLGVLASFTQLNVALPLWLLLLIATFRIGEPGWARFKPLLWFPVLLGAVCYLPLKRMEGTNQFQFWGQTGFYKETLSDLVKSSVHNNPYLDDWTVPVLAVLIALFAIGGWIVAVLRWQRRKWQLGDDLFVVSAFLFAGAFVLNYLQFLIVHTPFLNARTAIFYYPLLVFQMATAGALIWEKWRARVWWYLAPVALFAGMNFIRCADLRRTYEWWFDADTFKVLNYLEQQYDAEKRSEPYTLDADWVLWNSFDFHANTATRNYKSSVKLSSWHPDQAPKNDTEFYYTLEKQEMESLLGQYDVALTLEEGARYLMRKKKN